MDKKSMQTLRVLPFKNVTKQSVFRVQRKHVFPDRAIAVGLARATGEPLGWQGFWLLMARSEL